MGNSNEYKVNRRRKRGSIVPALLLLVAAVLISLLVAGAWQLASGEESSSEASSASQISVAESEEASSEPPESSEPESSEPQEPEEPKNTLPEGLIPESDPVDMSYFADAAFVGDSITEGMLYYTGMENARILAGTGVNFSTIYSAEVVKLEDGTKNTIMDELGKTPYKKVYVMMGGNEVRDVGKELFLKHYERVLDDIRDEQPDALIYVQSMTPVTKNNNYKIDNARIDEYNKAILALCEKKGLAYLDVASSMKNAEGMLPDEASPKDGMHFGQPYFDKWYEYLKNHVAQGVQTRSQKEGELRREAEAKEAAASQAEEKPASSSQAEIVSEEEPTAQAGPAAQDGLVAEEASQSEVQLQIG